MQISESGSRAGFFSLLQFTFALDRFLVFFCFFVFCGGGSYLNCTVFTSIRGLYPFNTSSTSPEMSAGITECPQGGRIAPGWEPSRNSNFDQLPNTVFLSNQFFDFLHNILSLSPLEIAFTFGGGVQHFSLTNYEFLNWKFIHFINFSSIFLISNKKGFEFVWDFIEPVTQFRESWHLNFETANGGTWYNSLFRSLISLSVFHVFQHVDLTHSLLYLFLGVSFLWYFKYFFSNWKLFIEIKLTFSIPHLSCDFVKPFSFGIF